MKQLTEIEKAYLAGIIDGEGCVRLARRRKNNFMAMVIVTIKQYDLLCYLKEITGVGCIYKYEKGFKENWCPIHRWQVAAKQARDLLKAVLPYLRIKGKVAEVVLSMPIKRGHSEHLNEQSILFDRVKFMNTRGLLLKKGD